MNKEKALKSLATQLESTKDLIVQSEDPNDLIYLNAKLETLEGIVNQINNGNWDLK